MKLSKLSCKPVQEIAINRGLRRLLGSVLVVAVGLAVPAVHADGRTTVKIRIARESTRPAVSGEEYEGTLEIIAPRDGDVESVELDGEGWEELSVGLLGATRVLRGQTLEVPFTARVRDATKRLDVRVKFDGQETPQSFDLSPARIARLGKDSPVVAVEARKGLRAPTQAESDSAAESRSRGCQQIHIHGRFVYERTWRDNSMPADGDWLDAGVDRSMPPDGDVTDPSDVPGVDNSMPADGDFNDPGDLQGVDNSVPPDGDFGDLGDVPPDVPPAIIGADGILFEIWDDDSPDVDELMFSSYTDINGYFDVSLCWDDCDVFGCDTPDIYVRFECDTGVVEVQTSDFEEDYGWSTEDDYWDNFSGNDLNFGTITAASNAPAVHIHNTVTRAHRYVLENDGAYISKVDVQWPAGDGAFYNTFFGEIHLGPDEEWSEGTLTHEWGHHVIHEWIDYPESDYCNGICDEEIEWWFDDCGHCMYCNETDHDAFNEGFANWLGSALVRHWPVRYGIGTWTQLTGPNMDFRYDMEWARTCQQDNRRSDPWITEGFVAMLLRDIEDAPQDRNQTTCPQDALGLGAREIFRVIRETQPVRVIEFLERFRMLYPQHEHALRSTAQAVAPEYVSFQWPTPPVQILQAPACDTFRQGETIVLHVQANGSKYSLNMRWQRDGVDVAGGGRVSGETGDTLTITDAAVTDSGRYTLRISSCDGTQSATSAPIPVYIFGSNGPAYRITGWGGGDSGQLGRGTVTPSPGWDVNPGDVINLPDMVSVSAGSLNAIGLRNDGTVWSWGLGPLGNGTNGQSATPVRVNNLTDIVAISTGGSSRTSMALDAQGHVWTWGSDFYRQLGYAQPGGVALSPGQVNLECVTSISMGVFSAAAVTSDGSLYVWGYNGDGQLGQGTVGDVVGYNGPVRVVDLSNIVQVSCGAAHILARRADGTVWACGGNGQGQLGDGTTTRRTRFVQVAVINDAADISAGYFHSLAKRSDLSAWSWGSNSNHELGTGAYPAGGPYSTPARMLNPPTVRALDGGNGSSVMIAGDGTLWTCGNNGNGELGRTTSGVALDLLPTPVNSSVGAAVSASAGGNFMMVVAPGARIVAPVADKLAAGGSTVQLAVSAVGAPPLSYSWRRNGQLLANTGRISGADGPVLTIASSDTNDSGTFTVRVSNAANVVASDPVTLITPPLLNRFDTQTYADAWFTNQRGAWAVMGGGYAATNPSWNPATYNAFRLPLSDFSIELDVVNASFAGFSYNSGIWLRSSLKSHRYAADSSNPHGVLLALGDLQTGQPNAGDLYWTRWQGAGGQSPQGAVPNVYHTGDTVHLRVEVRGNTYSAFVNDAVTPTTQLTTAEFPAGSLGLFDSSAGDPLFDNVFIQTLPTCPSGSGLEPIRITQRPLSQTAPTGALVTLTVAASGSGPFTYQWLHNGLRIDAHGPSFAFTANNATAGRWECTVTNACGSVGSYPALVTIGSIGDSDGDGGVDLDDHADFVACLIGPQGGVQPGCAVFDIDGDADVDLMDFAVFQKVFGF